MYRKNDGSGLRFSPTDLTTFLESPFTAWMDRAHHEDKARFERDPEDAALDLISEKGNEHEARVLEELRAEFCGDPDGLAVIDRGEGFEESHRKTIEAMRAGARVIYQAALRKEPFFGYADFLIRRELTASESDGTRRSNFGTYCYEPWDSKLARSEKPYFVIQLLCYSEMLSEIQGIFPEYITLVLGTRERKVLSTHDYFDYYSVLRERFLEFQGLFDPAKQPVPEKGETIRKWTKEAEKVIARTDHLSQVANIRKTQIVKLESAGISTLAGLAQSTLPRIPDMEQATFLKLKKQAELQLRSRGKEVPEYEIKDHAPGAREGLTRLPPFSQGDIYFDMEGYPLYENAPLEYLFGLMVHESPGPAVFKEFWAHNRVQERAAFEAFVDYVYSRWKQLPDLHIYHYAAYEVTAVRRLSVQFGTREAEVDELLRHEVFVDLYAIVSQALFVGEPSYSIKYIEHLYRGKRAAGVTNAGDSIVEYAKYLASPDGTTWEDSAILRGIRDYNIDDCDSTVKLTFWLRSLQEKSGLHYQEDLPGMQTDGPGTSSAGSAEDASIADEGDSPLDPREVADALLAPLLLSEAQGHILSADERARKLIAELIEFHRRERKQYWWKYFDRIKLTHAELIDDSECIGAIFQKGNPYKIKRSQGCLYGFDPAQAFKFHAGDSAKLLVHEGLLVNCNIEELGGGELVLKLGPKDLERAGGFPRMASLLPGAPVKTDVLEESILRQAGALLPRDGVSPSGGLDALTPALSQFLTRARPRLLDASGASSDSGFQVQDIPQLDASYLCVQGPPGAGKTYHASRSILSLLKGTVSSSDGGPLMIGITSNSHSAIENLLMAVLKEADSGLAQDADRAFDVIKVGNESETLNEWGVRFLGAGDLPHALHAAKRPVLVGGTAWAFAREDMKDLVDWLFVDEAGQVSLANLVAFAPSCRNFVLLGDQRQLEQPIQGSHPGESGESALKFLLQDHVTIPADLGVFLDNSRRMRKSVCDFISSYFYEGRLHSDPSTEGRRLVFPAGLKRVAKTEGLLFVPETRGEHSQKNPMEIETIGAILEELKQGVYYQDQEGSTAPGRALTEQDVLIVAPYNLQVNALKEAYPDVRIGTVDKFQGQEAPVVIFSMTASSLDEVPRGLEFLMNPNRLNVAISRAQCLAIVVGNPNLRLASPSSVENMQLLNLFCGIVRRGLIKVQD